jgi:hypothetical protein
LDDAGGLHDQVVNIAPSENRHPIGFFQQPHTEESCFPREFCGAARPQPAYQKIDYAQLVRWELRSQDRRFAANTRNIFFKAKEKACKEGKGKGMQ